MIDVRLLTEGLEIREMVALLDRIWGTATAVVGMELATAIGHGGGYLAAVDLDGQMVGGSVGFLARHHGADVLHSHITGLLPTARGRGVGWTLKQHQRAWAADRDLVWVTWTFDPLVRRNAWFNLGVLGAEVSEYLVDFYGPMDDDINGRDESDRLLVVWPTSGPRPRPSRPLAGLAVVPTPEDIVTLRRTDAAEAQHWRHRMRGELGGRLGEGGRVVSFTRGGDYLVEEAA